MAKGSECRYNRTSMKRGPYLAQFSLLTLVFGAMGFFLFGPQSLLAQSSISGDGVPPKISQIEIASPTATSVTIQWVTDEDADSEVNYGLNKNYGVARDPNPDKKKHKVTVEELDPATIYHLRIGSADDGGNQSLSGDYTITTKGVMSQKELDKIPVEDRVFVDKAIANIRQLKSIDGVKAVAEAVGAEAKRLIEAPVIIGTPRVDEVGSDYAKIFWATDQDSGSEVHYARESEYKPDADDPYTTREGDAGEKTKEHNVRIVGLNPGVTYHFRVESEGELGMRGQSRDGVFTTKAALPTISSFRVVKVEEDSATLAWRTNIPAAGVVEYTNTKTKEVKSAGSPIFASSQVVKIAGLRLGNRYQAVVKAENALGEKVTGTPIFFTTVKDTAPPLISKVSNESTLYPSADAKVQTIVSWSTDEPSFCQFFYREGLNPNIPPSGSGEEKQERSDHVQVVVEFQPSTVYQFWVECRDSANNKTKSENFVLFTPNKEKSIIDIILENFQGTFGWVKNIGGKK